MREVLIDRESRARGSNLEQVPVGIVEVDRLEVRAIADRCYRETGRPKFGSPIQLFFIRCDLESKMVCRACSYPSGRCVGILEKGHHRPRRAFLICEVEVFRSRIVEVDGSLDKSEPQEVTIKRDRSLHVGADERYVVEPADLQESRSAYLPRIASAAAVS